MSQDYIAMKINQLSNHIMVLMVKVKELESELGKLKLEKELRKLKRGKQ